MSEKPVSVDPSHLPEKNSGVSRRDFIKVSVGGSLLLSLPGWAFANSPGGKDEWWFIHLSDSHNGSPGHDDNLRQIIEDGRKAFPQARFSLNTGDITEHGWQEELDNYATVMPEFPHPHFEVMGNHDSRWSRAGRYAFRKTFGGTRWDIEHEFLSVFAIDCSVLLEQHGHMDPSEHRWLEEQLERIDGKPCMIAFHHPPCDRKRFLDTDGALFELAARHNVMAVLGGHVHTMKNYRVNGAWVITSGATMTPRSGYNVFRVRPDGVTLFNRRPLEDKTIEVGTIPTDPRARGRISERDIRLKPRIRGGKLVVMPQSDFNMDKLVLQVNGHPKEFRKEGSERRPRLTLAAADLAPGHYEVELVSPDIEAREQRRSWGHLEVEPEKDFGLLWERAMPAGIQTRPASYKETWIVGFNDGQVKALSKEDGKEVWTYDSGPDAVLSSPAVRGDWVYFGTMDHHIHCLEAGSGQLVWSRPVEGSVIASGRFAGKDNKNFIVGTGQGKLYSVDAGTSRVNWVYQAGNLIKATPAYDGKRLYFGAWDGHFYAVDAGSGKEVWKVRMQTPHYSPATCNPEIHEGKLVVVTHDYRTRCLDPETGESLWMWPKEGVEASWDSPILADTKPSYSSAVFHEGVAYFGSLTGHVVGFDMESGERVFVTEVDDDVFDSFPIKVGDVMYFGTIGGTLYGMNLKTKNVDLKYSLGSHFIFSPPESDGKLVAIGSLGGELACLRVG
jgi:outer membrane protein assembly factor BamB/predicted phosphodiesterase